MRHGLHTEGIDSRTGGGRAARLQTEYAWALVDVSCGFQRWLLEMMWGCAVGGGGGYLRRG